MGASVEKDPWSFSALRSVVMCRSEGVDEEDVSLSKLFREYTTDAILDLPCLVSWFGSWTTNADAFP
jgi:hypothetical protein